MDEKANPYGFTGLDGRQNDWSGFIGEVAEPVSGHWSAITKEELAVICARKDREHALVRALCAMKAAGEEREALSLVGQFFC